MTQYDLEERLELELETIHRLGVSVEAPTSMRSTVLRRLQNNPRSRRPAHSTRSFALAAAASVAVGFAVVAGVIVHHGAAPGQSINLTTAPDPGFHSAIATPSQSPSGGGKPTVAASPR